MQELILMIITGVSVILVIWRSVLFYSRQKKEMFSTGPAYPRAAAFLASGFRMDKLYEIIFVRPFAVVSRWSAVYIDQKLVDGIVNGIGKLSLSAGLHAARLQNGYTRSYAGSIVLGIFIFTGIVIWFFKG